MTNQTLRILPQIDSITIPYSSYLTICATHPFSQEIISFATLHNNHLSSYTILEEILFHNFTLLLLQLLHIPITDNKSSIQPLPPL